MAKEEQELSIEDKNKLESIDKTLKDILKWTRFANISKLKEILEGELDSDEKKLAYENTDGENGLREVAVASGPPQDTIYGWWQKWFRLGLATESLSYKGRIMKIVSLEDVGIKVPKKKAATSSEATPERQGQSNQSTKTE
jgi:hypothetical protein